MICNNTKTAQAQMKKNLRQELTEKTCKQDHYASHKCHKNEQLSQ